MSKHDAPAAGLDPDQIDTILASVTHGITTYDKWFNIIDCVKAITILFEAEKKGNQGELKTIQVLKLKNIIEVSNRTGLKFMYGMPDHSWNLVRLKSKKEFRSTFTWLEFTHIQFRSSPF
ncbi:MAG: hypothetical protein M1839_002131 [Geoglossum umbratile]|nr:MAG: hypothetical protein M1839_002131 [Geoglossum umbratile]